MKIDYNGKNVFITGAGRGIGREIKNRFEELGAIVRAPSRQDMDLADTESIERYLQGCGEYVPDVFIHCAGINTPQTIEELSLEKLRETYQVNVFSAVQLVRAFSGGMKKRGGGRLLFVSSLYGIVSREGRIAYSGSKNALTGVTKTLALEFAPYNIMVNAVAPGYVMTELTRRNLTETQICEIENMIPTRRFQGADEIASAVLFLCSSYNMSITGQLLAVDGGFLCR